MKAAMMETVELSAFRKASAIRVRVEQRRCASHAEVILRTADFSTMQMRWKLLCTAKEAPL
eukprot:12909782-Heterocapsa_arctica.AAC.1